MDQGAGVYGSSGTESERSLDQLMESLSESEDEGEATGIIQKWLETLPGNNDSYNPIDTRA